LLMGSELYCYKNSEESKHKNILNLSDAYLSI
jgi:hypothetical protein